MVFVTKSIQFSASHRVYNPELTDKENINIYGKCANPNGHGHNFTLEVTVCGKINPSTGYVIDLKVLKNILEREIVELIDHKNLNVDVAELDGIIPTSENLVVLFWKLLKDKLPSGQLYKVKLSENNNSSVEYLGENNETR